MESLALHLFLWAQAGVRLSHVLIWRQGGLRRPRLEPEEATNETCRFFLLPVPNIFFISDELVTHLINNPKLFNPFILIKCNNI